VLVSLNTARSRARDAQRLFDLKTLSTAISEFYIDNGYLPRNGVNWCTYISNPTSGWGAGFQSDIVPKYVSKAPLDPLLANQVGDYFYANKDNIGGHFTLCAVMENPSLVHTSASNWSFCTGWTAGNYTYCVDY